MTRPEFLILDEPDSGVDPEHLKRIGSMINEILHKENNQCSPVARNSGLIATHIVRGFLDIGVETEGLDPELERTIQEISELSGYGEE